MPMCFIEQMRTVAATKAGRVLFRPTAHRLDQLVSKLTSGKRSFAGIAAGLPAVLHSSDHAAFEGGVPPLRGFG